MTTRRSLIISILLLVGVIGLLNYLGEKYFWRFDLTEDNRYTLSQATNDMLDSLNKPVTVTAYFSENLPPDVARVKTRFKNMLNEYANRSGNQLVYEFINPSEDKKTEREARRAGIQPMMIQVREKNQMKQKQVYMGAVLKYGKKSEVLPVIRPGTPLEYKLSSGIKKLSIKHKRKVALLQGHGEPGRRKLRQVRNALSVMYRVENVTLTDTTVLHPSEYKTAALVAPEDSFPDSHLQKLEMYLRRGGNLFIGLNRVKGNMKRGMGQPKNTRLEGWLAEKGIQLKPKFIVDARSGRVSVQRRAGGASFRSAIKFPYIPIIQDYADHPITKGLEPVTMRFASPMKFTGDTSLDYKTLARSSKYSGIRSAPLRFKVRKEWTKDDFNKPRRTVAAAIEGPLAGTKNTARMVVVSDGDFPVGRGRRGQTRQSNVNFMVNAIDWLSDDTGLIALRNKGTDARPLKQVEAGTKTFLKYLNFLLPVLLVIGYGVVRKQIRHWQREKLKNERYEV